MTIKKILTGIVCTAIGGLFLLLLSVVLPAMASGVENDISRGKAAMKVSVDAHYKAREHYCAAFEKMHTACTEGNEGQCWSLKGFHEYFTDQFGTNAEDECGKSQPIGTENYEESLDHGAAYSDPSTFGDEE